MVLSRETAGDLGVHAGDTVVLRASGRERPVRVLALIEPENARSAQALRNLVVADVTTAQEVLDQTGRLSRVDLALPGGSEGDAILARLRAALPPGVEIVAAPARSEFLGELTRAFDVNLTALSLLALMVGLFLAYNTMTFSVVQRRATIGMLRALGVTRAEIVGVVLAEALLLALVATVLGLGAGIVLAGGLVRLVTRTINDLYFVVVVRDLAVSAAALAKGAALGIGATLVAALLPAAEASTAPPGAAVQRVALEARARRAAPRVALAGLLVLLAGASVLAIAGRSLAWSYAGLFTMILSAALLTPLAMIGVARAAGPPLGGLLGLTGRMAARGVVARLSRTGVAVAALMVAVSATVGVGVMIRSFRATVERWLETSLAADVYVSAPTLRSGRGGESTLAPGVVERLRETPGVVSLGTYRGARVLSEFGPTQLVALGIGPGSYGQFRFLSGEPGAVWPAFQERGAAIVSESYAYRHGLAVGRGLRLRTDRGERVFPVAGVFVDYGSDQGVVMVSRRTYDAYWDDRGVSSLGVVVAPGADVSAMIEILRARAGAEQDLLIRSNRALREASLEIFDRTFAITAVLRVLATAIAVIGVLSALMALQLERVAGAGRPAGAGAHAARGLAAHARGDGAPRGDRGRARGARGHRARARPDPRHQPPLVRMVDRGRHPDGRAAAGGGSGRRGRARRGGLSRVADVADAARARSQGGVTSVRRRHPGVGLLVGVVASVTVIAAGLALVIRLDGGRSSAPALGATLSARGGARDDGRRGVRAGAGATALRLSRGPRPPSDVSHRVVVLDREPPRVGERGRPALRVPADVLPHGAGADTPATPIGLEQPRRVSRAPRGDGRRGGPVPGPGALGARRAGSRRRGGEPAARVARRLGRRGDRRRRGVAPSPPGGRWRSPDRPHGLAGEAARAPR